MRPEDAISDWHSEESAPVLITLLVTKKAIHFINKLPSSFISYDDLASDFKRKDQLRWKRFCQFSSPYVLVDPKQTFIGVVMTGIFVLFKVT